MNELEKIIGDYNEFLGNIIAEIEAEGFDMSDFVQMDHICYRTSSLENYKQKQLELSKVATLLGEVIINDRPISTYRLHRPIIHKVWRIDTIELPAPKTKIETNEGLEHVELVLYDSFETFLEKYNGKPFNLSAVDRGINPDISLKLPSYRVKFHLLNLPTVVYLEGKLDLTNISA